jgi:hypothetical protein
MRTTTPFDAEAFVAGLDTDPAPEDVLSGGELIIDKHTGSIRQSGADTNDTRYIAELRAKAEGSLYVFAKGVLRRDYLTPSLHRPVCTWLQHQPPRRKLLLLPREHAKTSIVSHALPLHLIIQPRSGGLYFQDRAGTELRILMAGEAERRACDNLRVVQTVMEANQTFRGFWPHVCWDNPQQQSKKWNEKECIIPRETAYADPTFRAIGVGGAITGARHDVHIKDDLISVEAANSAVVMEGAIHWDTTSQALLDGEQALEFIIGTRWAVYDLYAYRIDSDPHLASMRRSVVEEGHAIWPERFTPERISELRKRFGTLFPLLYMNEAADPELVDFLDEDLRTYTIENGLITFEEDSRDAQLAAAMNAPATTVNDARLRGVQLTGPAFNSLLEQHRGEFLRFRRA